MDLDIEELRNLIFDDGKAETYDNDEVFNYITELASCGIEKLGREGAHLTEEKNVVLTQIQDLVYANYKTFIHSADCSQTIFKEFGSVEGHLEHLRDGLVDLREGIDKFAATSHNLSQARNMASLTLSKHPQLLEILELPQLMDTCVRNGYYDDALEILAYVKRIERKHSDIPIVAGIVNEVKGGTRLMLLQLLMELRSPLTLPQSLKVIGLLRRLDIFSELELRLKFLQARDSWFTTLIKGVPKDDAYQHINKVIELSRVHLFDIITQYRAIFWEEDSSLSLGDNDFDQQNIFYGWIVHKVNQFLSILEKDLAKGVGSNLENLVAQCMFFGQSFSRIGADFRNLLNPIFQNAIYEKFETDVRSSNFKFDETLSSFSLTETAEISSSSFLIEVQDKTTPPLSLMEFIPFVYYTNGLVNAFNGLRQCCPLGLLSKVSTLLSTSVSKVILALVDLREIEGSGLTATEVKTFERMCCIVSTDLIPHINTCLRLLFPLQNISNVSGIPITTLQKQNIGQLDIENLSAPIQKFIAKNLDDRKDQNIRDDIEDEMKRLSINFNLPNPNVTHLNVSEGDSNQAKNSSKILDDTIYTGENTKLTANSQDAPDLTFENCHNFSSINVPEETSKQENVTTTNNSQNAPVETDKIDSTFEQYSQLSGHDDHMSDEANHSEISDVKESIEESEEVKIE